MEATQELLEMVDQTTIAKRRLIDAKHTKMLRTVYAHSVVDILIVSDQDRVQKLEDIWKCFGYLWDVMELDRMTHEYQN